MLYNSGSNRARNFKSASPFALVRFWNYSRDYSLYSTLNKITQFWLVESSTINPKLYSVGVLIKFPWKWRNFVECTINKKSHDLLVQFVNNRYSWFWEFSNCTRRKARAILRTFKITRTYWSRTVLEVVRFPIRIVLHSVQLLIYLSLPSLKVF